MKQELVEVQTLTDMNDDASVKRCVSLIIYSNKMSV